MGVSVITCGCCGLDDEGNDDANEGPKAATSVFGAVNHGFP